MPMTDAPGRHDAIAAGEWVIDARNSSVRFTLKHFMFAKVNGSFHEFRGALTSSAGTLSASGAVAAGSIETGDEVRDQHLRDSADFFGVAQNPEITFNSTRIEMLKDGTLDIRGELQMRGVTRPIELRGTVAAADTAGEGECARLSVHGEIDRGDFGLTWNQRLDTGGALLGNRVKIDLQLLAVRMPAA